MDIDVTDASQTVAMGTTSIGIRLGLHGLVMMNVSEHIVRNTLNPPHLPVVGALLGTQKGQNVELITSFELVMDNNIIDEEYIEAKKEQYKEIMPECDILGWYTTSAGAVVAERHVEVHKQFMKWNDNSLMLLADPNMEIAGEGLPFGVYESVVDTRSVAEDGQQRLVFCPIEYDVATAEAERVAIDHVATKIDNVGDDGSKAAVHIMTQHAAVKMLMARVTRILNYLHAVERGNVKGDISVLRSINALVGALSLSGSAELNAIALAQKNEVLLSSYISLMTQACESIDEITLHAKSICDPRASNRGPSPVLAPPPL